jgi:peroxiredoxin
MTSLKQLLIIATAALLSAATSFGAASIGQPAPEFELTDTQGNTHKLSDYAGKVVVLEWINDGCPFVQRHYVQSSNMQTLQETYTGQGVIWLSICSSASGQQGNHSPAEWEAIRQQQGHHSTALLIDEPGTVGRLYGAKTTPHMYVIDASGVLVYNGAIDNNKSNPANAENYVKAALDAVLSGQPVQRATSTPYGCGVKYDS